MKYKRTLSVIFVFGLICLLSVFQTAKAQDQYSLPLGDSTWDKPTIQIIIIPKENESWWQPHYVNSTLKAIDQWNYALDYFAANNSQYAYLSAVNLSPTVSDFPTQSFDIYVSWVEIISAEYPNAVGLASIKVDSKGIIENCNITLASASKSSGSLNENDIQNIAIHELGHSLSLKHSSYSGDVMYSALTVNSFDEIIFGTPIKLISTLDVYGVAKVFHWMTDESRMFPISTWLPSHVTSPGDIEYEYLPAPLEDAGFQIPVEPILNPIEQFWGFVISRPEFLILILFVIITIITVVVFRFRHRH